MFEDAQTLLGHAGGKAIGIMLTDDRPGLAARAGAQERFFQHDDPAGAALGQPPGDAGAHHAAADDKNVAIDRHEDARNVSPRAAARGLWDSKKITPDTAPCLDSARPSRAAPRR